MEKTNVKILLQHVIATLTLLLLLGKEAASIPCDSTLVRSITTPAASDTVNFNVAANEVLQITVMPQSGANFDPQWRVLDAAGNPATSGGAFGVAGRYDFGPLAPAGNPYRIEVVDGGADAPGTYTINLQRLTATAACEGVPLPCDSTVTWSLSTAADSDLFTFDVSQNEMLEIALMPQPGANFDPQWRVLDAAGNPATSGGAFGVAGRYDFGPLAPAGNPYRIEVVDGGADAPGTYTINLQRLTATAACEGVPLPCDSTVTWSLSTAADSDLFTFDVSQNEMLEIALMPQPGANFDPQWRVLDAAGNPATSGGAFGVAGRYDFGPLAPAGNPYRIEVVDGGADAPGTYTINLQRLTATAACEGVPLPCDSTVTWSLSTAADSDLFTFDVSQNEMLEIALMPQPGANFDPQWRVLDAAGNPATSGGAFGVAGRYDFGPLAPAGNPYRIEVVDGGADAPGTYTINLQRLTATAACEGVPLPCDSTVTWSLSTAADSDLFTFDVSQNEMLEIALMPQSGANFDPQWRVLDAAGNPATSGGAFGVAGRYDFGPLTPAGNPYRIEVVDGGNDGPGTYKLHLEHLAAVPGCGTTLWTCNQPNRTLPDALDADLFTVVFRQPFAAISIAVTAVSGANFQPIWRLLDTTGQPTVDCGGFHSGSATCGPFSAGNPYRIEVVDSDADAVGIYSVSIDGCSATDTPPMPPGPPTSFRLGPNYPNPFNPTTTIGFDVPTATRVTLKVYDVTGREVATLVDRECGPGNYQVQWNAQGVTGGVYVCSLRAGAFKESRRLVVTK